MKNNWQPIAAIGVFLSFILMLAAFGIFESAEAPSADAAPPSQTSEPSPESTQAKPDRRDAQAEATDGYEKAAIEEYQRSHPAATPLTREQETAIVQKNMALADEADRRALENLAKLFAAKRPEVVGSWTLGTSKYGLSLDVTLSGRSVPEAATEFAHTLCSLSLTTPLYEKHGVRVFQPNGNVEGECLTEEGAVGLFGYEYLNWPWRRR